MSSGRFLTYGSACQDCGFNNQRLDLEEAARLALASNRTLVVRNFVCSPHSPCPSSNASTDGVIAALGGVTNWRAKCASGPPIVCDKGQVKKDDGTRWGAGVRFLDARLFVDPAYFTRALRVPYMWTDEFHERYPELVQDGAADSWVLIQRKQHLSQAEHDAPVWHVAHFHKGNTVEYLAPNVPRRASWPPRVGLRYAPWLHHVTHQLVTTIRGRHGVRDFACVHCRLGDWGVHNGLSEGDFQPHEYAKRLARDLHQKAPKLPSSGRHKKVAAKKHSESRSTRFLRLLRAVPAPPPPPSRGMAVIYLATPRKNMPVVVPSLSRYFEVETFESVQTARRIAETGAISVPTEDIFSCIEQLVCLRSSVFVGTPASTVTQYVHAARAAVRLKANATRKPPPYLASDLLLPPTAFFKSKKRSGAEREKVIREYWEAQQKANPELWKGRSLPKRRLMMSREE